MKMRTTVVVIGGEANGLFTKIGG